MNDQSFFLQPFLPADPLHYLKITGRIVRQSNKLIIHYKLSGPLAELVIPVLVDIPARKKALWEESCFEFFIGTKNSDRYREFNLSPAGHWNVYSFNAYRQGMQEEQAFTALPFSIRMQPDNLVLSLELDLGKVIPVDMAIEVAISAVIKPVSGNLTYWALNHPGSQADFHLRDSFIIDL